MSNTTVPLSGTNQTTHPRRFWGRVNIPLQPGTMKPGEAVHCSLRDNIREAESGHALLRGGQVKWPDGTSRWAHATCRSAVIVQPGETADVLLSTENGDEAMAALGPHQSHEAVQRVLFAGALRLAMRINGRVVQFDTVKGSGGDPAVQTTWLALRDEESGFVADILLDWPDSIAVALYSLRVGFQDSRTEDVATSIESLEFLVRGPIPSVWFADKRGMEPDVLVDPDDGQPWARVRLCGAVPHWGDAQLPAMRGALQFLADPIVLSMAQAPMLLCASGDRWDEAHAYGVMGSVPLRAHWLPEDGAALASLSDQLAAKVYSRTTNNGGLFMRGWQQNSPRPGQAGDQPDFMLAPFAEVLHTGCTSLLNVALLSADQEACRPMAFREVNGRRVRHTEHPFHYTYQHYTHEHPSYNRDRLGKPAGQRLDRAPSQFGDTWQGWPPSHESIEHLAHLVQLTNDQRARDVLEDWMETWLSGHPIESDTYLDGIGSPRAFGRTTKAAVLAHAATGRQDILDRALDRFRVNYRTQAASANAWPVHGLEPGAPERESLGTGPLPEFVSTATTCQGGETYVEHLECLDGEQDAVWVNDSGPVPVRMLQEPEAIRALHTDGARPVPVPLLAMLGDVPLPWASAVFGPDPRGVPVPNWSPWQEAFVAVALVGLWRFTGAADALKVATRSALGIVYHGVRIGVDEDTGQVLVDFGGYLDWNEGQPLPPEAWDDPNRVATYSSSIAKWVHPAFRIAAAIRKAAPQFDTPELGRRLDAWDAYLQQNRRPGTSGPTLTIDGGWDGFTPWDAIDVGRLAEEIDRSKVLENA